MFDENTINKLQQPAALNMLLDSLQNNQISGRAAQAIPDGFTIANIEKYLPQRTRFTGTFETSSISSFGNYALERNNDAIRIFVDDRTMAAKAIFDFEGALGEPLHCEDVAVIKARMKAEYKALLQFTSEKHTQKAFAEFMEDYADFITCFDGEANSIPLNKAISAVRRIEINARSSATSEVQSFSAEKSALESMSVNEANQLPSLIRFTCVPYTEFSEFVFTIRPSVITGSEVRLAARMVRKEETQEEMADHFCELIENQLSDVSVKAPINIGTFSK